MSKGIIFLLIYVAWRIYKVYSKNVEAQQKKQAQQPAAPKAAPPKSGKDVFRELMEQVEREKAEREKRRREQTQKVQTRTKKEKVQSSEKSDWKFGTDELRMAKAAHEKHKTKFERSFMEEEHSEADLIADEFDLKKAVIYSEIMNRPYVD